MAPNVDDPVESPSSILFISLIIHYYWGIIQNNNNKLSQLTELCNTEKYLKYEKKLVRVEVNDLKTSVQVF